MRISDWSSDVCSSNLEANQIVASSVSGVLAHWRRGNVDFRMGLVLLIGGPIGSLFGVWLYGFLRSLGQLDLVISLCYVIFLGFVCILMFIESIRALFPRRRPRQLQRQLNHHHWLPGLPLKMP